jgi:uncharacterized protein YprB with RNaseH-like and TPR domain
MADDSLRRRLEALNRAPIAGEIRNRPGVANAIAPSNSATHPMRPEPTLPIATVNARAQAGPLIPGLLRRGEVVETAAGQHLRLCLSLDALWPNASRLLRARQDHLQHQLAIAVRAVNPSVVIDSEFTAFVRALPDRTLLLDLETCGLAGAALFLAGLLRCIDGAPVVELLLARNYAEEAAVLESLWQRLANHDVLVTFNGKSFDWPMVLERSIRHRLETRRAGPSSHIDVLHHARRRFRRHLPDCRLQTLERFVCRRERVDDIPGRLIPAVYAEYVRTGFERDMDAVLYHNAIDLVTLLDLSLRLAG